jgi:predicted metal-dependent hydrolase
MNTLTFTTRYSDKRKTLGLLVERDKSVVVLAPKGTSDNAIDQFINKRRFWIFEKLNHSPKFKEEKPGAPFISGKAIPYLGRNYKLDVVATKLDGIQFSNKFYISKSNVKRGQDLLDQWYKEKAKEKITPAVEQFARQIGVEYKAILISDLKYRWGSCTLKGNLNFNWRLIKAPTYVINYVVVHELAHLIELNHSERFWNIVRVQLPNYLEAKEWLRENGEFIF